MPEAQAKALDGFRGGVGVPDALKKVQHGMGEVAHDGATAKVAASLAAAGEFGAAKDHILGYARSNYSPDEDAGIIKSAGQQGGLVGTVLGITIAAVVAYVGITVMSKTEETGDYTEGSSFDNASESVTQGVESGMSLLEVVFIVLLLSLIVGALVGLRR
jgi:hypothetical protein